MIKYVICGLFLALRSLFSISSTVFWGFIHSDKEVPAAAMYGTQSN